MGSEASRILLDLQAFLAEEEKRNGGPAPAVDPGQRKQFIWPKQSLCAQYNIKPSDFQKTVRFEIYGEAFPVHVIETAFGVFGRCEPLWAEAKGQSEQQMLINLARELEPLFQRQFAISRILGLSRRFDGHIADLSPSQQVMLLYCTDRDVAHTAMFEIDSHAKSGVYTDALIHILKDETHPYRRTAQWCVLDIFEDLPNVCTSDEQCGNALAAIGDLMKRASDDYARTIYKAGDVLGDHVANKEAMSILLDVLENGTHPYGRRSAIHGMIHLCEWLPEARDKCIEALSRAERTDPEFALRAYAKATIEDIIAGGPHGPEPVLAGEQ